MWMSGSRTIHLRQAFTSNLPTVCSISISTDPIHTISNAPFHTLLLSAAPASISLMTCYKTNSVPSLQLSLTVDISNTSSVNKWKQISLHVLQNLLKLAHLILTTLRQTEFSCRALKLSTADVRISTRFSPELDRSRPLPPNLALQLTPLQHLFYF